MNNNTYEAALDRKLRDKASKYDTALLQGESEVQGYYYLPAAELNKEMTKHNLFRRFGTVIKVKADGDNIIVPTSTAKAEIVDDFTAFPDAECEYKEITVRTHKIASLAKLSTNLVSDAGFDVTHYLTHQFALRFARAEEDIFLNGTGNNEPLGILKTADAGAVTKELTYDDIIKLYFSVNAESRDNGVWVMGDETAVKLRSLKDKNGNYLWNSHNDTIFGKPVVTSIYMTDASTPVLFGDLSQVWILVRDPLAVKVLSERYILDGQFGYGANERIDVQLIRPETVKVLKVECESEPREDTAA